MNEATKTPEAPTTELLPCPFCGEKPAVKSNEYSVWEAWCSNIECTAQVSTEAYSRAGITEGWNERAEAPAVSSASSGEFYRVPCGELEALVKLAWELAREVKEANRDTPSATEAERYTDTTIARVAQIIPPARTR